MGKRTSAVVALGMFDGMHIGHRALIERATRLARSEGALSVVDTFLNHPAEVLGGSVRMLSTAEERERHMRLSGADEVRMRPFTREYAAWSPERFVEEELSAWDVRAFVVGFNYTFGERGSGTPETLRALGERHGFLVETAPPVLWEGEPVSSTRIRMALERGDVAAATEMLGRPYALEGDVIANRRIGRRIGFPTANIAPDASRVLPKDGVYAALARTENGVYPAMTNVGTNPTVGGETLSIESHLLDYDGDLYGKRLTVSFLSRIRDEQKFASVEALKEQLTRDVLAVRARVEAPPREA